MNSTPRIRKIPASTAENVRSLSAVSSIGRMFQALLRNSVEANANVITVKVGLNKGYLGIYDNGNGIQPEDLKSFVGTDRASSKIEPLNGETLFSIGKSCSLKISSRFIGCGYSKSFMKTVKNGNMIQFIESDFPPSMGTLVEVNEIFAALPVRQSIFHASLSSIVSNMLLIARNLSLKYPQLEIILIDESGEQTRTLMHKTWQLDSEDSFKQICGNQIFDKTLTVSHDLGNFSIHGLLSPPSTSCVHHSNEFQFILSNDFEICSAVVMELCKIINDAFEKCYQLLFKRKRTGADYSSGLHCAQYPVYMLTLTKHEDKSCSFSKFHTHYSELFQEKRIIASFLLDFFKGYSHAVPDSVLRSLRGYLDADSFSAMKVKARTFLGKRISEDADILFPLPKKASNEKPNISESASKKMDYKPKVSVDNISLVSPNIAPTSYLDSFGIIPGSNFGPFGTRRIEESNDCIPEEIPAVISKPAELHSFDISLYEHDNHNIVTNSINDSYEISTNHDEWPPIDTHPDSPYLSLSSTMRVVVKRPSTPPFQFMSTSVENNMNHRYDCGYFSLPFKPVELRRKFIESEYPAECHEADLHPNRTVEMSDTSICASEEVYQDVKSEFDNTNKLELMVPNSLNYAIMENSSFEEESTLEVFETIKENVSELDVTSISFDNYEKTINHKLDFNTSDAEDFLEHVKINNKELKLGIGNLASTLDVAMISCHDADNRLDSDNGNTDYRLDSENGDTDLGNELDGGFLLSDTEKYDDAASCIDVFENFDLNSPQNTNWTPRQARVHNVSLSCEDLVNPTVICQLDRKYIVLQKAGLLYCADQHAVHERIRLEQLENILTNSGSNKTQSSNEFSIEYSDIFSIKNLKPAWTIDISLADANSIEQHRLNFELWGVKFYVHRFGSEPIAKLSVKCIPIICGVQLSKRDILEMLHFHTAFEASVTPLRSKIPSVIHHILKYKACRGAIKFGDELSIEKCCKMMKMLNSCKLPFQCAHGRPSVIPICRFPAHILY